METRKTNLFVGDRSFSQHWNLSFNEIGTERKFQAESLRFHSQSLQYISAWSAMIWLYLYILGEINFASCALGLVILLSVRLSKVIIVKRLLLQVVVLLWEVNFITTGSISECFGIFLPSFVLNFFLLKSWTKSMGFFAAEVVVMYYQTNAPLLNLVISALTFVVLSCNLEKDFRDLWHLYASYKKSCCLIKALWDTSPSAQILVNTDGKIIHYNTTAAGILKKQNKSMAVLDGGKFENFLHNFQEQSSSMLKTVFKGEVIQEIYQNSTPSFFNGDFKAELAYAMIGDLVSWTSGNTARFLFMDVSKQISKRYIILNCFRNIYPLIDNFSKLLLKSYSDEKLISREAITSFNRICQFFISTMSIQSGFAGVMELHIENFDVASEICNSIELLYLKTSQHGLTILYTREKGIPPSVFGDRSLHNVLIFSLLDFVIGNSMDDSEVILLVQVLVSVM